MKEWKLEGVSGLEGPSLQSGNAGDEKEARNKAVYYLQFSSKTEWELRKKLAEQGFLPASVDSAIRFCEGAPVSGRRRICSPLYRAEPEEEKQEADGL